MHDADEQPGFVGSAPYVRTDVRVEVLSTL
jgi:hypothetical protein